MLLLDLFILFYKPEIVSASTDTYFGVILEALNVHEFIYMWWIYVYYAVLSQLYFSKPLCMSKSQKWLS